MSDRRLVKWLRSLPKPLGVFACNDVRGRQVLAACDEALVAVPDEVAVLGVDNDPVICDLAVPPLSSIEPDTRRLGFEGAALLDRMMSGYAPPAETVLLAPRGIQTRLSSDFLAVADDETAAALRFIRQHACEGLSVDMLVRRLALSRTTLDRKFQRLLGRSPKAEIDRVRIERAKQLLQATDYKLSRNYRALPECSGSKRRLSLSRPSNGSPDSRRGRIANITAPGEGPVAGEGPGRLRIATGRLRTWGGGNSSAGRRRVGRVGRGSGVKISGPASTWLVPDWGLHLSSGDGARCLATSESAQHRAAAIWHVVKQPRIPSVRRSWALRGSCDVRG